MITIKLMGGYGNQLFQYALGLELHHRGYQIQFDKRALAPPREYALHYFEALQPLGEVSGPIILENGPAFNPEHLSPPPDCTMVGYWQSEKYFLNVASKLRDLFWQVPHTDSSVLFDWSDKICASNSVAVHVRRQDYLNLQHFHGMPGIDYYRKALSLIPDKQVFVFSDDLDWCWQNFPKDFTIVTGTNKFEDMKLMGACKHNVIANSSFGWWGAWMGYEPRTVIAPKRWFANEAAEAGAGDIVPSRWIRV